MAFDRHPRWYGFGHVLGDVGCEGFEDGRRGVVGDGDLEWLAQTGRTDSLHAYFTSLAPANALMMPPSPTPALPSAIS